VGAGEAGSSRATNPPFPSELSKRGAAKQFVCERRCMHRRWRDRCLARDDTSCVALSTRIMAAAGRPALDEPRRPRTAVLSDDLLLHHGGKGLGFGVHKCMRRSSSSRMDAGQRRARPRRVAGDTTNCRRSTAGPPAGAWGSATLGTSPADRASMRTSTTWDDGRCFPYPHPRARSSPASVAIWMASRARRQRSASL
jgi:hypothetical protein